ncbi:glutathione S-transferase family protein [Xanthobacter oligotrophicus]|uniref:glutathione S-transferase family protein n=1 Tax=Xanthobacter oligotrophicus TaxID=2607286 RepID=UPI0011F32191|nr:glutathione S-transferase family protein [Xanthobacter oligotrophicus]MCG5234191.1 glutathione S-transferase family protein [Xanthobacter oligotrophicus]
MLTLYSYPELFGVADNNGYGLKVFAYLKLAGVPFEHRHLFDASAAPRGQLPYIEDDGVAIGDSEAILAHVRRTYGVTLDDHLGTHERTVALLVTRMLDDLYWVMSYSRWKDEEFWPQFRDALMGQHPVLTAEALERAKAFNAQRYYYQGIGRYAPPEAYGRGLADLAALADLVPAEGFLFGQRPSSTDAAIYGFLANIHFYPIATPLKAFVDAHENLVRHCTAIHALIGAAVPQGGG